MFEKFIEKIHKRNVNRYLNKQQKEVDKLYEKDGFTEEVHLKQLEINKTRNQKNISDKNEEIFDGFVQ